MEILQAIPARLAYNIQCLLAIVGLNLVGVDAVV